MRWLIQLLDKTMLLLSRSTGRPWLITFTAVATLVWYNYLTVQHSIYQVLYMTPILYHQENKCWIALLGSNYHPSFELTPGTELLPHIRVPSRAYWTINETLGSLTESNWASLLFVQLFVQLVPCPVASDRIVAGANDTTLTHSMVSIHDTCRSLIT